MRNITHYFKKNQDQNALIRNINSIQYLEFFTMSNKGHLALVHHLFKQNDNLVTRLTCDLTGIIGTEKLQCVETDYKTFFDSFPSSDIDMQAIKEVVQDKLFSAFAPIEGNAKTLKRS